jgi:hypothetical protein
MDPLLEALQKLPLGHAPEPKKKGLPEDIRSSLAG